MAPERLAYMYGLGAGEGSYISVVFGAPGVHVGHDFRGTGHDFFVPLVEGDQVFIRDDTRDFNNLVLSRDQTRHLIHQHPTGAGATSQSIQTSRASALMLSYVDMESRCS